MIYGQNEGGKETGDARKKKKYILYVVSERCEVVNRTFGCCRYYTHAYGLRVKTAKGTTLPPQSVH